MRLAGKLLLGPGKPRWTWSRIESIRRNAWMTILASLSREDTPVVDLATVVKLDGRDRYFRRHRNSVS